MKLGNGFITSLKKPTIMEITKKHLTNGQYLTHEYEKKSLFLHHTVSTNPESAWRWWNSTPERVGTAYIIDRQGGIIECFDPKVWAYHLGVVRDDNWHEKHSINIELVAAGPLRFEEGEYRFYPLWPNKFRWTLIPENEIIKLKKAWRGYEIFHNYTNEQLESLKWLIGKLYLDFPGLRVDNDLNNFFEYDESVIKEHKPGIWSHSTVRLDKSDIVPTPDLIKALKEVQNELLLPKTEKPKPESKPSKSKSSKKKS